MPSDQGEPPGARSDARGLAVFGRNLRAAREAAGLAQADLERLTGIRQHHISAIENGHSDVKLRTMIRLARAVGKDVRALLTP